MLKLFLLMMIDTQIILKMNSFKSTFCLDVNRFCILLIEYNFFPFCHKTVHYKTQFLNMYGVLGCKKLYYTLLYANW